ncbi:hypothetical protein ACFWWS_36930, partial [Streptomyces sp. NPDC059083]
MTTSDGSNPATVPQAGRGGVEDVLRAVVAWFVDPESGALPRVEEAALAGIGDPFNTDPVMAQEVRESTRLNVRHWATTMATAPQDPVMPTLAGPVVGIAREVIRRGAD